MIVSDGSMHDNFDEFFTQTTVGFITTTPDGIILQANDKFVKMLKLLPEDIIGKKRFQDFLSIGSKVYFETHYLPQLELQGTIAEISFDLIDKDRLRIPVLVNSVQVLGENNRCKFIRTTVFEITQRKQYEKELIEAKKRAEELSEKLAESNRELLRQAEVIIEQKRQLEEINANKDKFFRVVAHDLKSPLHSLKSFVSLITGHFRNLSEGQIMMMANQLKLAVDNTITLTDNLVTWAQIQMKELSVEKEVIVVDEILSSVYALYKDVAFKKQINIEYKKENGTLLFADRNQLTFVVRNLVDNAIKYTPVGGTVQLFEKAVEPGKIKIFVRDSGIGISEDQLKGLFSRGFQRGLRGTEGEPGTGLGLTICYDFINKNSGSLDVESQVGIGTTFVVTLDALIPGK